MIFGFDYYHLYIHGVVRVLCCAVEKCQTTTKHKMVNEMKMQKSSDKYESCTQLFLLLRQSGVKCCILLLCYTAVPKCE